MTGSTRRILPTLVSLWLAVAATVSHAAETEALWAALKSGGHVALMRHALAPGTGDPANFRLDDPTTQRNLSDTGRAQARRIGQAFRERDIPVGRVLSSRWNRCLETAELLNLGAVEPLPALDSFFRHWERRDPQTAALKTFLDQQDRNGPSLVLVTHQVNITALTGVFPSSGEIVVLRLLEGGGFEVLGQLTPG